MNNNDIILTGPPRSGTTLSCHLLNKLPNFVALHEPMNLKMFSSKEAGLKNTRSFFGEMRKSLLKDGTAIAKVKDGKIPDNPFDNSKDAQSEKRQSTVKKGQVHFNKRLDDDFQLAIKQNAHFTFMLDELIKDYPCYAIIRNPLSTISSWNSITAPVSNGNLTVLKGINPWLYRYLESKPDLIERQVHLLHEIFSQYEVLSAENIIKYEVLITSHAKALSVINPNAKLLYEDLESANQNKVYNYDLMSKIAETLLQFDDGAFWNYYNSQDVIDMVP